MRAGEYSGPWASCYFSEKLRLCISYELFMKYQDLFFWKKRKKNIVCYDSELDSFNIHLSYGQIWHPWMPVPLFTVSEIANKANKILQCQIAVNQQHTNI